ncbi:MAG TPA: hypothetical protein VGC76_10450 [Pyrinomonadaceae bacterium]|jgi:hypothetical protein
MLTILGIVLIVVSTIYIYRTAKQNGHNAVLWTVITALAGVALELVIPLALGIIIASVWMSQGKSLLQIQQDILVPAIIIGIVCLVLNFVVVFLIMKKVSPIAEENLAEPPPPPSDFNVDS